MTNTLDSPSILEEEIMLRIEQPSHNLIHKIITTLPMAPRYSEITMSADGVRYPKFNDEQDEQRYLKECQEKKIIPFTKMKLKYDNELDFIPEIIQCCLTSTDLAKSQTALQIMIKGGRHHKIRFENGFKGFKEKWLTNCVNAEYKLEEGDIWLTTYHLTEYNQGDYADTRILFGINEYPKGVDLKIGSKINNLQADSLKSWFKGLRDEHYYNLQKQK